jgi:hypothetical protein
MASCADNTKTPSIVPTPVADAPKVGADQDEHGCKGSAGYIWSVVKNECIRIFESGIRLDPKAADLDQTTSAFIVFKSETDDLEAELYLPGTKGSTLLKKGADNGAGIWKNDAYTLSQWKGMYTLSDKDNKTLYQGPSVR